MRRLPPYSGLVGCYSMDLYCEEDDGHKFEEMPHQYTGPTGAGCNRDARKDGWILDLQNRRCWCPKHRESGRKIVNADRRAMR